MGNTFRDALLWHMDAHSVGPTELATATGVSLDAIKKLRGRGTAQTATENAILIAGYFGKSVEQFMKAGETKPGQTLSELTCLLTPEEERIIAAQIQGLLVSRGLR